MCRLDEDMKSRVVASAPATAQISGPQETRTVGRFPGIAARHRPMVPDTSNLVRRFGGTGAQRTRTLAKQTPDMAQTTASEPSVKQPMLRRDGPLVRALRRVRRTPRVVWLALLVALCTMITQWVIMTDRKS